MLLRIFMHKFLLDICHHFAGYIQASQVALLLKNLPAMQEMQETELPSLGQEDTLDTEMATPSNILAWRISWTEKPGGLQSTGSQRVGHG